MRFAILSDIHANLERLKRFWLMRASVNALIFCVWVTWSVITLTRKNALNAFANWIAPW
jgi:Icc-related predicted phosphoesterase